MPKNVLLKGTTLGKDTGPFLLYHTSAIPENYITACTKNSLITGITISVPDGATVILVVSDNSKCSNYGIWVFPTPTNTPTNTPTSTPQNTPENTPQNTPTNTITNTPQNTVTNTNTPLGPTPTRTGTNTPLAATPTFTPTRTSTKTSTPANTPQNTSTGTLTNTPLSATPTNSNTNTPLAPTPTNSNTNTPLAATPTYTATNTNTPLAATPTNTLTSTPTSTPTKYLYTAAFISCGECPGDGGPYDYPSSIYSNSILLEGYFYANPAGSGIVRIGTFDGAFGGTGYTFGPSYALCANVPC